MDSREKRIQALAGRFKSKPGAVTSEKSNNSRKRHSVYIDAALMQRIDSTLKEVNHAIYPAELTKSLFLERLLEKGLENLDALKATLGS